MTISDEVDSLVDYCEKLENMVIARDSQIKILEAQVAALKKIAEEERAAMLACAEDLHGIDGGHLIEARRQLAEEHPEVDWEWRPLNILKMQKVISFARFVD